jgi:carbonic anhydrase
MQSNRTTKTNNIYNTANEWQKYFEVSKNLHMKNNSTILRLNLTLLMGDNLDDFWRYKGSLTTPPCTENIIWSVFKIPIMFNDNDIDSFRKNILYEGYRGPQILYDRKVYRSFLSERLSSISDYYCCSNSSRNKLLFSVIGIIFLYLLIL